MKLGLLQVLRVLENGLPSKIFGSDMEELNGDCRRRRKEKLYDLNNSSNIILVTTSRIMRWTEPVAHMERGEIHA
jgi:hypothetical protein